MAWEDRTPEEQAQAEREAEEYAARDDNKTYQVLVDGKAIYTVRGINSARVVAGKGGTIHQISD